MAHSNRIQVIDLMRGIAVIVMVMGHSIDAVLNMDVRSTELFRLYDAVRGFTAPMFLFVSGLTFAIATEKRWAEFLTLTRPLLRRMLKILLVLAIGYALHFPFFSFTKLVNEAGPLEMEQFFQVDVLHCVAGSLLFLHLLVVLTRTPRRFAITTLALATGIVITAPFIWNMDLASALSPVVAPYFNQKQMSIFPLFPYAAFLLVGAVVGHFFLAATKTDRARAFFAGILCLGVTAGVCGLLFDPIPVSLYPPHDFWKTSPNFFLIRLGIVMVVTAGVYFLRRVPSLVGRLLAVLGQASLFVYVVHLIVVYGSAANDGLTQAVGRTLHYPQAFGIALLVLCGMLVVVHAWNYMRAHYSFSSKFVQAAFASTLLFYFFTKPY